MASCASFHLLKFPAWRQPLALARLGTDRLALARTPGLRFWRLLGTGRGASTGPGADLGRTALFAVWDDDAALDRHLERGAERAVREQYVVRLHGVGGHGTWNGFDVLGAIPRVTPSRTDPVAVLTRARVHVRHWRTFAAAAKQVDAEVQSAEGLLRVCGIGEAPLGLQATFSLWESGEAARQFAKRGQHRDAVRTTRRDGWFGEELFASFAPYRTHGTWDGEDPLSRWLSPPAS